MNHDPQNLRFKLAKLHLSSERPKDPKWNEEAAKNKLLEFFDLLGFNDPNVVDARKKLSSMMFK